MKINSIIQSIVGSLLLILLFPSCAPTRLVKPLQKGEQAIGGNFGGPLIKLGSTPITIPYTSAFYAKGLTDKTSVYGSMHLTALAFGVFQTDIGVCRELYSNQKYEMGLSVNPALTFAVDRWEWNTKIWPQLDVNIYKNWGAKKMLYAGVNHWFEPSNMRAHNEKQEKFVYVNPHVGFMYTPKKWTYGIETKWVAPSVSNVPNVADYIGINKKGAIGVYVQFVRRF
ncbi:MAG: hypothetical protein MH472_05265 [Bacteroidia bacterium]|nr:hypothetical protein [Bacteroidia bacterium]